MADETQTPTPQPTMKKWTVTMKDGTVYHGVLAPDAATAQQKMTQGPQGPLAPKPSAPATEAPARPGFFSPGGIVNLPDEPKDAPPYKQPSGRELAGDLVPLVAGLIPGGRTIGRAVRTLGANVLGRGAVEAGAEAISPTGQGPLAAGVSGAAKGIIPGLVQAGVGAALGPNKDTIQVQKAAKALKAAVSPEVGSLINPAEPAKLLSRNTVRGMSKAAGSNLDKMEAEVERALGPEFRVRTGQQAEQAIPPEIRKRLGLRAGESAPYLPGAPSQGGQTFSEVRAKIKELRSIGDKQYTSPEMRNTAKAAMQDAAQLEAALVAQMPPKVAATYKEATARHAKDMDAVRWVKGLQQENKIRGGVNPQDRPELAAADRAIRPGGSVKGALHGVLGAAEAATGRPIGAGYHLGRAADQMRSGGPLRPTQKTSQTIPAITRGVLGTGTAAAQTAVSNRSDDE